MESYPDREGSGDISRGDDICGRGSMFTRVDHEDVTDEPTVSVEAGTTTAVLHCSSLDDL